MASKHTLDVGQDRHSKRQRKGFQVGPENLPDGTHRRKVQKIKRNLIDKAKLKNDYAKAKARMLKDEQLQPNAPIHSLDTPAGAPAQSDPSPNLDVHPDRIARLAASPTPPPSTSTPNDAPKSFTERRNDRREKTRQHRANRKQNATQRIEDEAVRRRDERAEAAAERERKVAERELYRRRMAKARRPGKDGKRRLGRESALLLQRVRKMVGGDGTGD